MSRDSVQLYQVLRGRQCDMSLGIGQGGTALFSIGNLMAIALERCKTARCAILGSLEVQWTEIHDAMKCNRILWRDSSRQRCQMLSVAV